MTSEEARRPVDPNKLDLGAPAAERDIKRGLAAVNWKSCISLQKSRLYFLILPRS